MGGISKSLGKVVDSVAIANVASVTKGMNLSGPMLKALTDIAGTGDQRAAFNAVLMATAANVSKKPNFNLELEINDLWIRLGNLRSAAPAPLNASGLAAKMLAPLGMSSMAVVGNLESAVQALAKDALEKATNFVK